MGVLNLTANVEALIGWDNTMTVGSRTSRDQGRHRDTFGWPDGIGQGQANLVYNELHLVTANSPTLDLDLFGSLTDAFGNTLNFLKILAILVQNKNTGNQLLRVGGAGSANDAFNAPFGGDDDGFVDVGSESTILIGGNYKHGFAVIAGNEDVLRFVNVSATEDISFEVTIIGRTS